MHSEKFVREAYIRAARVVGMWIDADVNGTAEGRTLSSRRHDDLWEDGYGDFMLGALADNLRTDPQLAAIVARAPVNRYAPPDLVELARSLQAEPVRLADGEASQGLIPGVTPISGTASDLGALSAGRAARRGRAPLPAGGLFDETARAQQELF